ncbi:glycosyltransferase family 4 protein, partial [bacterium]|nr:glycosyltransferase family 4 protein [bacterium]
DKFFVTLAGAPKIVENAGNSNDFKSKFNIKHKFILYVGNAYPHKNLDIFIDVVKRLDSDIQIVLAGKKDYFYEILERKVNELNLKNRIIFTNYVSDNELFWLYKNALALVFPSFNEGFGLPLLEAASFGTPIITSNTSSLPEIIGDAALYFDPSKPKEALEQINKVNNDDKIRVSLVEKGLERIKLFSWKAMAKATLEVYKKALNE